jgi:predicted RNase H-like nuclease (RuvC/YqgF family)
VSSKIEQIKDALSAQEIELSEASRVYEENEKNIARYTSLRQPLRDNLNIISGQIRSLQYSIEILESIEEEKTNEGQPKQNNSDDSAAGVDPGSTADVHRR